MNITIKQVSSIVLLTIIIAANMVGCAQIRKLTYPKDFTYLEKKEVAALMRNMGNSIARLELLVAETESSDIDQQQKIVAELNLIEKSAIRLSGGNAQTNHIVINDHIESFISDIGTAKMFARMKPPRYYNAGKIAGSCTSCHSFR